MKLRRTHTVRAALLGTALIPCVALVLFTASLTSMSDLRTRLANDGDGLLCQLGRHTSQSYDEPYVPASQWYVDLSSGIASKLNEADIVAKGLRCSHTSLHTLFGVRQDMIVRQKVGTSGNDVDMAMLPVISNGKIKELVLDRRTYSLLASGSGENFRIEWGNSSSSTKASSPEELLMHAIISAPADRIISYSSRGPAKVFNIQLRDLNDPSQIIAQWKRSKDSLPLCDAETIYTVTDDQSSIERRSLQTGALVETIPLTISAESPATIIHPDIDNNLFIGHGLIGGTRGITVANFRTGVQIAFVTDARLLDYAPVAQSVLLELAPATRKVLSIRSGKIVALEGVKEGEIATLHLSTNEPRVVAVLRDGSIRIHSLPDGQLISKIESMQNHKDLWLVLSVFSFAAWIVCLMVTGRRANSYESIDIVIALAVTWVCLVILHQRTCISIGLGATLSSFSHGATCAVAIFLTEWSTLGSARTKTRLIRFLLIIGLLGTIAAIEVCDELIFDYCDNRESVFGGIAFVLVCASIGRGIQAWHLWRFSRLSRSDVVAEKRTQWSIVLMLKCMALVAVACSLLNFAAAQERLDWLWLGKFLLVHLLVIVFAGMVSSSVWRNTSNHTKATAVPIRWRRILATASTIFFAIVFVLITSLLNLHFLFRRFPSPALSGVSDSDFCIWYTVGFFSLFSTLLYRTWPRIAV